MKKSYIAAAAVLCAVCLTGCAEENSKNDVRAETGIYTEITPAAVTAAITENPIPAASADTDPTETETGVCAGITEKILETVEMSSMAEVGSDRLHIYLNCEIPQDCDFSMYICGSGGFADEVFVINTDGVDMESLKSAVDSRIEARIKDFEGYNPDEVDKLENYYTDEAGGYYIYAVTADNPTCESIFLDFTK